MRIPTFIRGFSRYYFPFFGSPCCDKASVWMDAKIFTSFKNLSLSPRASQSDLLIIVGQISHKHAPVLQHVYQEMLMPNSVIHLKGCSKHHVGYASLDNLKSLLPVHFTLESCPIEKSSINQALKEVVNL